jgi:hypothetical protein
VLARHLTDEPHRPGTTTLSAFSLMVVIDHRTRIEERKAFVLAPTQR